MIVDIHCHFVPEKYFEFVQSEKAYGVRRVEGSHGEDVPVSVRDLTFGLNRTFFDPERQIRRMDRLRIARRGHARATRGNVDASPPPPAAGFPNVFNDEAAD